jgi:hypothetical protein
MRQFRQGTALGLYGVVGSNIPRYVWGNLFILFGMVFIAIALKATTTVTKNRYGLIGDLALGLSLLLWFCELFGRIFMTTFIAQAVLFHSMPVPTTFPMTVGVGREPLLISSTLLMLLAISLVTWSLQCSGFLSKQWSQLTIGLILASGMGGLFLSRNAGGTERAVLYALVVVVLLLAGWTLRTAKA